MSKNNVLYTVLMLLATVYGNETEDEISKYEYLEIFSNIPTLFEYLLNRIVEKPEMMERNDITAFVKSPNINQYEYGMSKRNAYCENGKYAVKRESHVVNQILKAKRENTIKSDIELAQTSNKNIRQIKDHNKNQEVQGKIQTDTTLQQNCFGKEADSTCNNKNKPRASNEEKDVVNRSYYVTANIDTPGNQNNFSHNNTNNIDELYVINHTKNSNKLNKKVEKKKREGTEKYLPDAKIFNLSPEKIEDAVLMVEQMLEDYNEESKEVK